MCRSAITVLAVAASLVGCKGSKSPQDLEVQIYKIADPPETSQDGIPFLQIFGLDQVYQAAVDGGSQ